MANSAVVDGKEETAVKAMDHNRDSEESLVGQERYDMQPQEISELIPQNPREQLDERVLLLEIQRQLTERDHYLRAKDIQLQEMEERICMYVQSGSYRLGRTLTWPLRSIKKLFG